MKVKSHIYSQNLSDSYGKKVYDVIQSELAMILIVRLHNNSIIFYVMLGDVARVNGQLAVSRAFGDKNLKTHLRSDPDITNADVDSDTELLILASDGLWKVIASHQTATSIPF